MRVSNQYRDRATPMAQRLRAQPALDAQPGIPTMPVRFSGELQDSRQSSFSALSSHLAQAHGEQAALAHSETVVLSAPSLHFQGRREKETYTPASDVKLLDTGAKLQWQRLKQIYQAVHFYFTAKEPEFAMKRPRSLKEAVHKGNKQWNKLRARKVFRALLDQLEADKRGQKPDPVLNARLELLVKKPQIERQLEKFLEKGIKKDYLPTSQVEALLVKTALKHVSSGVSHRARQFLLQKGCNGLIQHPVELVGWHREATQLHGNDSQRARKERISTLMQGLKTWQDARNFQSSITSSDLRADFFLLAKALFAKAEPGSFTPEEMESTLQLAHRYYRMEHEKPVVTAQDVHMNESQADALRADLKKIFKDSPELLKQTLAMVAHLEKARDIQMAPFKKAAEGKEPCLPLDRLEPDHVFAFTSMTPLQARRVGVLLANSIPGFYLRNMVVDLSQHPDDPKQQQQQDEVFRVVKPDGLYTRSQHRIFVFCNLEKSLADPKAEPTRKLWLDFARNSLSKEGLLSVVGKGDTFGLNKQKNNIFLIPTEKPLDTLPAPDDEAELLKSFMTPRFPVPPEREIQG